MGRACDSRSSDRGFDHRSRSLLVGSVSVQCDRSLGLPTQSLCGNCQTSVLVLIHEIASIVAEEDVKKPTEQTLSIEPDVIISGPFKSHFFSVSFVIFIYIACHLAADHRCVMAGLVVGHIQGIDLRTSKQLCDLGLVLGVIGHTIHVNNVSCSRSLALWDPALIQATQRRRP